MTFLTIVGITEILCSFRLVLEGKVVKGIPESSRIEFLKKVFSKQFCFIRCRRQHLRAVEYTFVDSTISSLLKVLRTKFLGIDGLFCFSNKCKFGSFKNPFARITSLSELYFRFRRFILLLQTKKVISMNYGSSISSWKPW